MSIEHIEILVEEPSMEAFLRILLPTMLDKCSFQIYANQSKHEMLSRLQARLQGYSKWLPKSMRIVVLLDQDRDDCKLLKSTLESMGKKAALKTRTAAKTDDYQLVNRIVIEELEAWYFGDWKAVCAAYPNVPHDVCTKAQFRDPDKISGGTWEAFEQVMRKAGYFKSGLRKIEAAQHIAPHMLAQRNTSKSFQVFFQTINTIMGHE